MRQLLWGTVSIAFLMACNNSDKSVNVKPKDSGQYNVQQKEAVADDSYTQIDTFIANGVTFRLIKNIPDSAVQWVERWVDNQWVKNLSVDQSLHTYIEHDQDVNGDGFVDFLDKGKRHWSDIHFFLPNEKKFSDTAMLEMPVGFVLLNKERKIYCNEEALGYHATGKSALYTFKGFQPYYFYILDYVVDNDDPHVLKEVVRYRCMDGNKEKLEKPQTIYKTKTKHEESYDYEAYWKREYKKLLDNK